MGKSPIEWTEYTWNPIRGCSRCSEGCRHCYAEMIAARFSQNFGDSQRQQGPFAGFAIMTDSGPRWTGKVALVDKILHEPLRWRKPRLAFISMSDPWHESLDMRDIAKVYAVMAYAQRSTFQILTKRSANRRAWMEGDQFRREVMEQFARLMSEYGTPRHPSPWRWPLPNVHEGVSIEAGGLAWRIADLIRTPAARRFVSYEPALEYVNFDYLLDLQPRLDQVIIGGESGPGARCFHFSWARALVKACRRAQVAVFVKQLGARPVGETKADMLSLVNLNRKGSNFEAFPPDLQVRELIS